MRTFKHATSAVVLVCLAGLFGVAWAQRESTTRTALYTFQGNKTAKGFVPDKPNTFYVAYTGKVQSRTSTKAAQVKSFSLSLKYKLKGGVATVTGGEWTLTTVREGESLVIGGSIEGGFVLPLKADKTPAAGTYTLPFTGDDPALASSGTFTLTTDEGDSPKVGGSINLNYTVEL